MNLRETVVSSQLSFDNGTNTSICVTINKRWGFADAIPAHSSEAVGLDMLMILCEGSDPSNCIAKIFTPNCNGEQIATFVFDVKEGLKSAQSNNQKYTAEIFEPMNAAIVSEK